MIQGTATAGEDFTAVSGSLVFGPGEATRTVAVPILAGPKPAVEITESFLLQLHNPQNATISRGEALASIADDDSVLVIAPDTDTDTNIDNREVRVYSPNGQLQYQFHPFGQGWAGGVRVAAGDFNGDGVPDIVTSKDTGGPQVRVLDGASQGQIPIHDFDAFHPAVTGGVFVAAADVTGDGKADLITSANAHVRIWNGVTLPRSRYCLNRRRSRTFAKPSMRSLHPVALDSGPTTGSGAVQMPMLILFCSPMDVPK